MFLFSYLDAAKETLYISNFSQDRKTICPLVLCSILTVLPESLEAVAPTFVPEFLVSVHVKDVYEAL